MLPLKRPGILRTGGQGIFTVGCRFNTSYIAVMFVGSGLHTSLFEWWVLRIQLITFIDNAVVNMSKSMLIKLDIDYSCKISNCIVIPTSMTEIGWYVHTNMFVHLLRYAYATAQFFLQSLLLVP